MERTTLTKEEDEHICPKCKGKQILMGDTWICTSCDRMAYEDILWLIKFINGKKKMCEYLNKEH
jgi:ribosomal protein L37AE/L43A